MNKPTTDKPAHTPEPQWELRREKFESYCGEASSTNIYDTAGNLIGRLELFSREDEQKIVDSVNAAKAIEQARKALEASLFWLERSEYEAEVDETGVPTGVWECPECFCLQKTAKHPRGHSDECRLGNAINDTRAALSTMGAGREGR